jgi:hypothetical protein
MADDGQPLLPQMLAQRLDITGLSPVRAGFGSLRLW